MKNVKWFTNTSEDIKKQFVLNFKHCCIEIHKQHLAFQILGKIWAMLFTSILTCAVELSDTPVTTFQV